MTAINRTRARVAEKRVSMRMCCFVECDRREMHRVV